MIALTLMLHYAREIIIRQRAVVTCDAFFRALSCDCGGGPCSSHDSSLVNDHDVMLLKGHPMMLR